MRTATLPLLLLAGCAVSPPAPPPVAFTPADAATPEGVRIAPAKALKEGRRVEIRGRYRGQGRFSASRIEITDEKTRSVLRGVVEGVTAEARRLVVMGVGVEIVERTEFRFPAPVDLAGIRPGDRLKVEGELRADGIIEAWVLSPRPGEETEDEVEGAIEEVDERFHSTIVRVVGVAVALPGGLAVEDGRSEPDPESRAATSLDTLGGGDARDLAARVRFIDDDDYRPRRIRAGDRLSIGGRIRTEYRSEDNFDLDRSRNRNLSRAGAGIDLEALYRATDNVLGFLRGEAQYDLVLADGLEDEELGDRYRLKEAYVYVREAGLPNLGVIAGRQRFKDYREWLFDEDLDGVRAILDLDPVFLDGSVSTLFFGDEEETRTANAFLQGSIDLPGRREVTLYALDREVDASPDRTIHFGARSRGDLAKRVHYWAETAWVRGRERDLAIKGYAVDLGGFWRIPSFELGPLEPRPYLALGWAYGSGDDNVSDGTDRGFRSTQLEDFNGRFGGVTNFRYYGELLEPELNNIQVFTAALGVRPTRRTSIDLVYHAYLQNTPSAVNFRRFTNLDEKPNGIDKELGQEWDLIVGIKQIRDVKFELTIGAFLPGDAFDGRHSDTAFFVKFQADWRF